MKRTHYSRVELELWRCGQVGILSRLACGWHLRYCARCRQVLSELRQDDRFLQELRTSLQLLGESGESGTRK